MLKSFNTDPAKRAWVESFLGYQPKRPPPYPHRASLGQPREAAVPTRAASCPVLRLSKGAVLIRSRLLLGWA